MLNLKKILLSITILVFLFSFKFADAQGSNPGSEASSAAAELIEGVNALRVANGLSQLSVHPILMQIAQTEAEGIAAGMPGHWRPNNLTLGQWLLSLGYPLSGDLSLDGYRSENWITGPGLTVQDAITGWRGDDPHLNTMLSSNRSDIGAGVATSTDEWGQTVVYYVLETALQTTSGQMQYEAYKTLTAIATNQFNQYGNATQAAQSLLVPQYIMKVVRATARPDGDVIHEVKNGQSLWSIAIEYGVKIDQIQRLNNLPSTDIYLGQKLLVQKSATQPIPTPTATVTSIAQLKTLAPVQFKTSTPEPTVDNSPPDQTANRFSYGAIAIAALFLCGILIIMISRKK